MNAGGVDGNKNIRDKRSCVGAARISCRLRRVAVVHEGVVAAEVGGVG